MTRSSVKDEVDCVEIMGYSSITSNAAATTEGILKNGINSEIWVRVPFLQRGNIFFFLRHNNNNDIKKFKYKETFFLNRKS